MSTATDIMIERPMSRDAFSSALYATEQSYRCEDTRLYRLLLSGRCPRSVLLRYARSTYYSAILFCATVAEFAIRAPDPEAKLIMLENLLEEQGMHLRADRGIVVRPEQRHVALARRFLRACGGDENDVHPDAMHATAPGRALLAEGRWLEAVSFLLIGQELKFGNAAGPLFDALRRRGFAARDLAFFAVHIEGDTRHGGQALKLVADRADTLEVQRACLAAADAGAGLWFTMHGGRAARATA